MNCAPNTGRMVFVIKNIEKESKKGGINGDLHNKAQMQVSESATHYFMDENLGDLFNTGMHRTEEWKHGVAKLKRQHNKNSKNKKVSDQIMTNNSIIEKFVEKRFATLSSSEKNYTSNEDNMRCRNKVDYDERDTSDDRKRVRSTLLCQFIL